DAIARLDLLAEAVRRLRDLAPEVSLVDALDDPAVALGPRAAAHAVDLVDVRERLLLDLVGEGLDEPRAAERIDDARHARLVREDLLRAKRDRHRLLGREPERLVHRVGVERLAPAQHA